MKLVIIGGTGLIGSKLVAKLREHGHEAVPASPDTGVNTLTGDGLAEVLQGASVVVDVSNSPSFEEKAVMAFFTTSTRNLLNAAAAAGVKHYVALSVVGTERIPDSRLPPRKERSGVADQGVPGSRTRSSTRRSSSSSSSASPMTPPSERRFGCQRCSFGRWRLMTSPRRSAGSRWARQ